MANPEHIAKLRESIDSWNQWREQNPDTVPELSEADLNFKNLSGANLDFADLSRANLSRANLTGATLRDAKLNRADLLNANLSRADLYSADLSDANFSGADLSMAQLERAKLYGTNLTSAILTDTDFDQAKIAFTTFADVDLSRAINLETVRDRGPSTIGIDTLYQSRGKIPYKFLKSCHVPEDFIDSIRSFGFPTNEFYSCFISYSHADKSFALRLYDGLRAKGIRCWLDDHQGEAGAYISDELDRAIRQSGKVLLCASRASLSSWWVDMEIAIVLEQEYLEGEKSGKKVIKLIPLNLDGYLFSAECQSGQAAMIRRRRAVDFIGWEGGDKKFDEGLELVIKALRI